MNAKNKKILSLSLAVISFIICIFGTVFVTWSATMQSTIEYEFANELKDSELAQLLGISSDMIVSIKKVDTIFFVGIIAIILSVFMFVLSIVLLYLSRNGTSQSKTNYKEKEAILCDKPFYNSADSFNKVNYGRDVSHYDNSSLFKNDYASMRTDLYKANLLCISGIYSGFCFPIYNNEKIVIGTNPQVSNIVLASDGLVSRYHCSVNYDYFNNCYLVTDYSLNGTFTTNGRRLPQNVPVRLSKGETIFLGDESNSFRLE